MAKLTEPQKIFIVRALACHDTPSQVAEAVKEEFGITLDRRNVAAYDPTKASGKGLSKGLREIFETTRKTFLEDVSLIPRANIAMRLRALDRMAQRAETAGNAPLAAQLLEQIAKEVGGAFTNRREITGKDGKPIQTQTQASTFTAMDPAEAARVYQDFIAGGAGA